MNKTLRTCAIAGAVFTGLGSIVAAEVGLTSHLPGATAAADKATAGNVTAAKNLEQCERELHAAHSRGYTWTFVPLGYDLDGNPAIKVKGVLKWWRENGVPPESWHGSSKRPNAMCPRASGGIGRSTSSQTAAEASKTKRSPATTARG